MEQLFHSLQHYHVGLAKGAVYVWHTQATLNRPCLTKSYLVYTASAVLLLSTTSLSKNVPYTDIHAKWSLKSCKCM